jgi:hypothetical protein
MNELQGDNQSSIPDVSSTSTAGQVATETPTTSETPVEDKSQSTDLSGFKSPEDLAKSYQELRTKLSQRDDKAKIVDEIAKHTGLTPEDIASQVTALAQEQSIPAIDTNRYMGEPTQPQSLRDQTFESRKIDALAKVTYEMKEDTELSSLLKSHPEAEPFKEQIRRIGRVETKKSHEDIFKEIFQPAVQAGTNKAYQGITAKESSQLQSSELSGVANQSDSQLYEEAKKTKDWTKILSKRIKRNR